MCPKMLGKSCNADNSEGLVTWRIEVNACSSCGTSNTTLRYPRTRHTIAIMASLHLLQATSLSSCQRCYQHSFANAQKRHAAQYRSVLKCKAAQVSSIEAPVNSRGPASLHRPDLRGAVKSIYTDVSSSSLFGFLSRA